MRCIILILLASYYVCLTALIYTQNAKVVRVADFLGLNRDDYELGRLSIKQQRNLPTRITWQYKDEIHRQLKSDLKRIDKQGIPRIEGR